MLEMLERIAYHLEGIDYSLEAIKKILHGKAIHAVEIEGLREKNFQEWLKGH